MKTYTMNLAESKSGVNAALPSKFDSRAVLKRELTKMDFHRLCVLRKYQL